MADDIDDLLDEAEEKFCVKHNTTDESNTNNHTHARSNLTITSNVSNNKQLNDSCKNYEGSREISVQSSDSSDDPSDSDDDDSDDIDDIIDDICSSTSNDTLPETSNIPQKTTATVHDNRPSKPRKRCYPLYVGGTKCKRGASTASNKLACNKLRCTRCDFKVTIFDNQKWLDDVDYLFLRNNVPDYNRLKPKLLGSKGCSAYCCQCMCRNFTELSELTDPSQWVCGSHPIDQQ